MIGAMLVGAPAAPPQPVDQCTVTDERLTELSGLVADADAWYAIGDGGDAASVVVLGKDCVVQREITGSTDPYDVEDLARAADGTFWLADTGDNGKKRDTVALISLTPDGQSTLYRLAYPDGAHDAEALLLDTAGTPYVVTKSPLGTAHVYAPAAALASPGPTPLRRVASVSLSPTDTPGGPITGPVDSVTVTGAASTVDGSVVALRTYTDAYLYPVTGGDLPAALGGKPVRVPLPDEAQGEAIAFDPNGDLVSAGETRDGVTTPVRVVPGAATLAAPRPKADASHTPDRKPGSSGDTNGGKDGLPALPAAAVTVTFLGAVWLLMRWLRKLRRR
jgi:hypothetical protein